jgi:putative ATP-binding cassette transporter
MSHMGALKLFARHAPNRTFAAVLTGAVAGLLYALLIPILMKAILINESAYVVKDKVVVLFGVQIAHSQFALTFFLLCILIFIFRTVSEILLLRVAADLRRSLRDELCRRISNASIASIELVGTSRLFQALTGDIASIVGGAQMLPQVISSVLVVAGMLLFLASLDIHAFTYTSEAIVFGIAAYQIPVMFGAKSFKKSRDCVEDLHEAFRGLLDGAKELKLNSEKRNAYKQQMLSSAEERIRAYDNRGWAIYSIAANCGGLASFFAIGGLAFVLVNYRTIGNDETISAVMVLLYLTTPIAVILDFVPRLVTTRIASGKLRALNRELPSEGFSTNSTRQFASWQTLSFRDVTFRPRERASLPREFELGPVNLDITRGKILFITGGNGSGKSMLAKLISQHYAPTSGSIFVDQVALDSNNITKFRSEIACIFPDYYLFDSLFYSAMDSEAVVAKARAYLHAFGIANDVKITNGRFSTLELSDGQRRRLALVVAMLEEKSLYIFDEWAADQDSKFKTIFYLNILPDIKRKNCAIVVVSHDERYFEVADQVLFLESGQVSNSAGSSHQGNFRAP